MRTLEVEGLHLIALLNNVNRPYGNIREGSPCIGHPFTNNAKPRWRTILGQCRKGCHFRPRNLVSIAITVTANWIKKGGNACGKRKNGASSRHPNGCFGNECSTIFIVSRIFRFAQNGKKGVALAKIFFLQVPMFKLFVKRLMVGSIEAPFEYLEKLSENYLCQCR